MKYTAYAFMLAAALTISGCSTQQLDLGAESAGSRHKPVVITGSKFNLQTIQPERIAGDTLRVYVEGDGRAWKTSRTINDDPTPSKSLMLRYALSDPTPSVYIARPCQFVWSLACNKSVWTSERFGAQSIMALDAALDKLKSQHGVQALELFGHSGGAAIALLLAAGREDVVLVQTIAGNLDHHAWTVHRGLLALDGSLNPADYGPELAAIPQRHLVGANDTVVPSEVSASYMRRVQPECGAVIEVKADHWEGFDSSWEQYRDLPVTCPGQ